VRPHVRAVPQGVQTAEDRLSLPPHAGNLDVHLVGETQQEQVVSNPPTLDPAGRQDNQQPTIGERAGQRAGVDVQRHGPHSIHIQLQVLQEPYRPFFLHLGRHASQLLALHLQPGTHQDRARAGHAGVDASQVLEEVQRVHGLLLAEETSGEYEDCCRQVDPARQVFDLHVDDFQVDYFALDAHE